MLKTIKTTYSTYSTVSAGGTHKDKNPKKRHIFNAVLPNWIFITTNILHQSYHINVVDASNKPNRQS